MNATRLGKAPGWLLTSFAVFGIVLLRYGTCYILSDTSTVLVLDAESQKPIAEATVTVSRIDLLGTVLAIQDSAKSNLDGYAKLRISPEAPATIGVSAEGYRYVAKARGGLGHLTVLMMSD